ncbi:MAG: cysteine hydrolase [Rhizobiales bacterium]|nr:cysteine hydrolase [Hyphomicrobiales bacterium]
MTDTMYLVLDMTNEFIHPEGKVGNGPLGVQVKERKIIGNTKVAIAKARAVGAKIGYVRVGFSPDYREARPAFEGPDMRVQNQMLQLGTWGCAVHDELKPEPQDFDIVKHRISAFYATPLEAILSANGIRKLYFSGVSSVAVVNASVRDAYDRDFICTVIEDCCAAPTPEEQDAAMLVLRRFARIVTADAVQF